MNSKIESSLKTNIDKLIYLYKSKNFNSALNLSNTLIELHGDNSFLLNINGIINLSLENWQNALLAFKKTLKQDNKFIEAYNNLGVTYSHLGESSKAIENYKKAIKLNKDYASAYNNLATQYDDFGEYSIAIKNYTKALKCNPEHLNAQNNLIRLLNFYKTDHLLGYARTEYHCKNCNAHHGHIFDDGPQPTGKRYCNNGVCLTFKSK